MAASRQALRSKLENLLALLADIGDSFGDTFYLKGIGDVVPLLDQVIIASARARQRGQQESGSSGATSVSVPPITCRRRAYLVRVVGDIFDPIAMFTDPDILNNYEDTVPGLILALEEGMDYLSPLDGDVSYEWWEMKDNKVTRHAPFAAPPDELIAVVDLRTFDES